MMNGIRIADQHDPKLKSNKPKVSATGRAKLEPVGSREEYTCPCCSKKRILKRYPSSLKCRKCGRREWLPLLRFMRQSRLEDSIYLPMTDMFEGMFE